MLWFLEPIYLLAFPAVLGLGLWALWRGRHHRQPVPAVRLWQGLTGEAAGAKRRRVDPVWLLMLLAALLAALAIPGPQFAVGGKATTPVATLQARMRAVPATEGKTAELFVQVASDRNLPETVILELASPEPDQAVPTQTKDVALAVLRQGLLWADVPAAEHYTLTLRATRGSPAVAEVDLARPPARTFAILASGKIPAALGRVIALQPGARPGDPTHKPAVYLLDDPRFDAEAFAAGAHDLIIASPRTPLPGVTFPPAPATTASAPATRPALAPVVALPGHPLLAYVSLAAVQVHRFASVRLSADWTVLATVDSQPWLAVRQDRGGATYVYCASVLDPAETSWPRELSFVVFFKNVLDAALPAGGRASAWVATARDMPAAGPGMQVALTSYLAAGALAVLLLALLRLVVRATP